MARTVILAGSEVIGFIENCLRPYIGVVADIADHTPLLNAVLHDHLIGPPDKEVKEMIAGYGIPTDVVSEVEKRISRDLMQQITFGFQHLFPGRIYDFEITEDNDVVINELKPGEVPPEPQEINNLPLPPRAFSNVPLPPPAVHQRRENRMRKAVDLEQDSE